MDFSLFSDNVVIYIILAVFVGCLTWLLPTLILSNAIKSLGKNQSNKMYIANENDTYFELDTGVRIYKKWYDIENDCYICEYGYYIPIHNYENTIISFVFMGK